MGIYYNHSLVITVMSAVCGLFVRGRVGIERDFTIIIKFIQRFWQKVSKYHSAEQCLLFESKVIALILNFVSIIWASDLSYFLVLEFDQIWFD